MSYCYEYFYCYYIVYLFETGLKYVAVMDDFGGLVETNDYYLLAHSLD